MKKILITGGTGFLGSAITREFIKKGYSVTVLDNDYRGKVGRLKDIQGDFEFIKGDIRDISKVTKASKGKDTIFHLAYINGTQFFYSDPQLVLDVGVKGITNVLEAAIKNKVDEIFLASSSEVYNDPLIIPTPEKVPLIIPDPFNPRFSYSGGKIISELMLLNYSRKNFKRAIIFRPHNAYGPDMGWEHVIPQFVSKIKNGKRKKKIELKIQGSGNETRSFIYIDDFVSSILTLIKKGKHRQIYNIGTVEEIKIKDLARKIAKLSGQNVNIKTGKLLPGSTRRRVPDISKISKLGFRQKISLDEGLEKTVKWYLDTLG